MKYYRVIDGVISSDPIEVSGKTTIAMADKTADGRPQYLLAQETIGGIMLAADISEAKALAILSVTDNRGE